MCKILEEERREGRKEGSDRINELNRRLLKDGREVDILKSLKEPGYQERLLMWTLTVLSSPRNASSQTWVKRFSLVKTFLGWDMSR